ncbi:MAG: 2'-deoxycytidine 5'-triphosphate deaminase [Chloroflexi bacterium]|nr:2'-deoxycytidine 5'-triphosphate deaminase [Chloroflexota bacterium]
MSSAAEASLFPELVEPAPGARGILPAQAIRWLLQSGQVTAATPIAAGQVQPASLDLRLGTVAHRVQASFLPGRQTPVTRRLAELTMHLVDLSAGSVLERGCVYVVPLQEELRLARGYSARANPKSSTGRLDVFTRLMTEDGSEFESVPEGYHGRLYLEIAPRTFSVVARTGTRLAQLRFVRGSLGQTSDGALPDRKIEGLHEAEALVYGADAVIARGLWISVDLRGAGGATGLIGYRARPHAPLVDLDRIGAYEALAFWEPIVDTGIGRLILNPGDFYLLASKERVSIPPAYAAEMVGYDPLFGEFRVHYAGFFDPGFGYAADGAPGTPAVLEVRSHEVPFLLEDGQHVARLVFSRLTDVPDRLYGSAIGSSYQRQGLALSLSKHFRAPA